MLGVCVNFPDYQHELDMFGLATPQIHPVWRESTRRVLREQILNPFAQSPLAANTTGEHAEKLTFRLSMPLFGHLLGLRLPQLILLQQLCGVLFLGMVYKLAYRVTGDLVSAALLPFAFVFSYVGQACFLDLRPCFDGMAYCGLAFAMYFRNPALIFLGLEFSFWTDERAVLVSPVLLMWQVVQEAEQARAVTRQRALQNPRVWTVVLAVLCYGAGRLSLGHLWQIRQWHRDISASTTREQWPMFLVGWACSLKWLWLLVAGGALAAILSRRHLVGSLMALFVVLYLASCTLVYDTTRSAAYAFPAVFVALVYLCRTESQVTMRWLVLGVSVLCFLSPSAYVTGTSFQQAAPVLPMAMKWVLGR